MDVNVRAPGGVAVSVAYGAKPNRFLEVVSVVAGVSAEEVRAAWLTLSATSEPVQLSAGMLAWDGVADRYTYSEVE